ncbi:MAG TPA: phosphatase PAP2 family protein [Solirubrobacteraceae bacterium]|jgi:undecaprenyl-diphosphatase|nr:phosphatase PAP2 family protein [Solirubrobacteraceae bacterium]
MRLGELDTAAAQFARTHFHPRCAERAIAAYSRTGEHALCWFALGAAGAAFDRDHRSVWLRGIQITAAAYAVNYAVKLTVRRRRPEFPGLPELTPTVSRLSFPSAHATTSFAAARAYRGLVPAKPLYAAAFAFLLSRPYLGVHYPGDVLAGAALGTLIAELGVRS